MITIPLLQLFLFGYAINTTPRDLPTAVLLQESSDVGRSILAALQNTKFFKVTRQLHDDAELDQVLASGKVLFAIEIPAGFERALRRGDKPALLVAADATDPVATGSARRRAVAGGADRARATIADCPTPASRCSRSARTRATTRRPRRALNIVPGLLGTILTLTMLIFTALSVTRETERGTMESLLAMPITPLEIMLGKIAPYVLVGFMQAALILAAGVAGVRRADRRQSRAARRAHDAVHRHQSVVRLHVLDAGAEPASGDPDVDDVLSAQHAAVGLRVPVPRHAGAGRSGSANACR